MYVYNDVTTDSRVLREADALAAAGHKVTIMARARSLDTRTIEREWRGSVEIVRVAVPIAWRRRWDALFHPWRLRGLTRLLLLPWAALRIPFHLAARRRTRPGVLMWLATWRFAIRGWAVDAAAAAPPADVHHGHDLTGLAAAVRGSRRDSSTLVYDSHEIYLEARTAARQPGWARALLARLERRWSGQSSALITVNEGIADELQRRLRPRRIVVVHNCAPRWEPSASRPTLLRDAAGVPTGARIVLYHGSFGAGRGLEQLLKAIQDPRLASVHLVLLGYGPLEATMRAAASSQGSRGRVHVLDAVPPDRLLDWITDADVGAVAIQPTTLNHRLSTPNKLFESLAAGVPVVASDFPLIRRIVMEDPLGPLGTVCDPADPDKLSQALVQILDQADPDRSALRERCLAAAHARWTWESEAAALLDLYRSLEPAPVGGAGPQVASR